MLAYRGLRIVGTRIGEPPKKTVAKTEEEEDTGIVLPPDLSIVGSMRKAEWMDLYLGGNYNDTEITRPLSVELSRQIMNLRCVLRLY